MPENIRSHEILPDEVKQKLEWFYYYEKHEKNARLTCRHFGISPDTFYRWKNRYDPDNLSSLEDNKKNRRPKNLREPVTPFRVVHRIQLLREMHPSWSNNNISTQLRNEGVTISCATVGRVLRRMKSPGYLRGHTALQDVKTKGKTVPRGVENPTGYNEYLSLLKLWKE